MVTGLYTCMLDRKHKIHVNKYEYLYMFIKHLKTRTQF